MNKPRFETIKEQAKEQCKKQYPDMQLYQHPDMIVNFFASGMEYRMLHEHDLAERTFLSCHGPIDFIMGYLQGKDADAAMIEALEEEARSLRDDKTCWDGLVRYFMDGLFYEESILEPNKKHKI